MIKLIHATCLIAYSENINDFPEYIGNTNSTEAPPVARFTDATNHEYVLIKPLGDVIPESIL